MTLYLVFLISVSVEKLEFKQKGRLQNEMLQLQNVCHKMFWDFLIFSPGFFSRSGITKNWMYDMLNNLGS